MVWVAKYRYPVLGGDVGLRCWELLQEISRSKEMNIYAGLINCDHVHMLIGSPSNLICRYPMAVQFLKGKSSHKLLLEYSSIEEDILGPAFVGEWVLDCFEW